EPTAPTMPDHPTAPDGSPPTFVDDLDGAGDEDDDVELLALDEGEDRRGEGGGRPAAAVSPFDESEHEVIPDPSPAARGGPYGELDLNRRDAGRGRGAPSSAEMVTTWDDGLELVGADGEGEGEEEYDPLEEDEAVAEFTLSRGGPERVEELDLAAMVDVAFQLV